MKATSTRQQSEQTTRPSSNCNDNNRHQNALNGEHQQQQLNYMRTSARHQHELTPSKPLRDNFKTFADENLHRHVSPGEFLEKQRQRSARFDEMQKRKLAEIAKASRQSVPYEYRNNKYNESLSLSDVEHDDDDSSTENCEEETKKSSSSDASSDDRFDSIKELKVGLKRSTIRYMRNIQSQIDQTMKFMTLREKSKHDAFQLTKPTEAEHRGAGDVKTTRTDEVYQNMEMLKKDCYRKIEANLTMLKNIDTVNSGIYNNQLNLNKP